MVPSKTYLKFKETHSQEDLETLNSYLKRLSEISDILDGDEDLDDETENKLYDEDEDLTDKTVRLIFGDVFFVFAGEYNFDWYNSWEDTIEDLIEDLYTTYQELHEA
nr:MAG: hypothetical protein [Bacteriophage sp.]